MQWLFKKIILYIFEMVFFNFLLISKFYQFRRCKKLLFRALSHYVNHTKQSFLDDGPEFYQISELHPQLLIKIELILFLNVSLTYNDYS